MKLPMITLYGGKVLNAAAIESLEPGGPRKDRVSPDYTLVRTTSGDVFWTMTSVAEIERQVRELCP